MQVRMRYTARTPRLNRLAQMPALFTAFANKARAIISQDIAQRFENQNAPDGSPWKPLSPATLARALSDAKRKVGGRQASPVVQQTRSGATIVRARKPIAGYQRTARVRRTAQSAILVNTGRLKTSLVSVAGRGETVRIVDARRYVLIWGSRVPYAGVHQYGTKRVPKRPFLPLSRKALARLQRLLEQEVSRP